MGFDSSVPFLLFTFHTKTHKLQNSKYLKPLNKVTEKLHEEIFRLKSLGLGYRKIHGEKYNYDKVDYKTMVIDVIIICKEHGEFKQQPFIHSVGSGCPLCSDYGFHLDKKSIFYIRKITIGKKIGLKYGITNQLDGNRENQQKRGMKVYDSFETIYKSPIFKTGEKVLEVENIIKDKFGKKGYFTFEEMQDGFTETIPFNKVNLDYIKSLIEKII